MKKLAVLTVLAMLLISCGKSAEEPTPTSPPPPTATSMSAPMPTDTPIPTATASATPTVVLLPKSGRSVGILNGNLFAALLFLGTGLAILVYAHRNGRD